MPLPFFPVLSTRSRENARSALAQIRSLRREQALESSVVPAQRRAEPPTAGGEMAASIEDWEAHLTRLNGIASAMAIATHAGDRELTLRLIHEYEATQAMFNLSLPQVVLCITQVEARPPEYQVFGPYPDAMEANETAERMRDATENDAISAGLSTYLVLPCLPTADDFAALAKEDE